MAIQLIGSGGVVAEVDGSLFQAQRTAARPLDYGTRGHYSIGAITGILPAALAANSEIFQLRWADTTRFCVVRRVSISASVSTTFFAAGVPVQVDLIKSTAWTVQGTGGTDIAPTTFLKRRATMASSLIAAGDMRIATTAALGAGTKTLEGLSESAVVAGGPITASLNGTIFPPGTMLLDADVGSGDHPVVLTANEGLSIRSVAVPATGTWTLAVRVDWAETASY